jgi:DnaJ-class molecular chaperone
MKSYYAILQLAQNESPAGIYARYRDMTKRVFEGADQTRIYSFQQVVEAYNMLSNSSRRRAHDKRLAEFDAEQASAPTVAQRSAKVDVQPNSIFGETHNVHPSLGALRERLLRNLTGCGVPKGELPECLGVEVVVDLEQATFGGVVCIGIPAYRYCPICCGSSRESFYPCAICDGRGIVEELKSVPIELPAHVARNSKFEVSLQNVGIHNLFLRADISVSGRS